jgi:sugar O-acyltransferase (sialic acid O-acetyltransferase NeuD family)
VSDKKIILIGYSGHGYVVYETAIENNCTIIGYCDVTKSSSNPYELEYLGFEREEDFFGWKEDVSFALGIGDNLLRQNIANFIGSKGKKIEVIIDKTATISNTASIGEGSFINKNATVNALAKIGKNVILNTGCIIEHECILGDAVHIAPAAILAGNVQIGERSFVGANAVIKQGIIIGKDVIIGAGSVVLKNVADGKKVVGNPSRII